MLKKHIKKIRSEVHTFRSKEQIESQKLTSGAAEQLELVLNSPNVHLSQSDRKAIRYSQNRLVSAYNQQEAPERNFTKVFPEYEFIQKWLFENSKRPKGECAAVWCNICMNLNPFSQDIALTRQEIAKNTDVKPCDVSTILNELASIGAVGIRKEGRETIYSINPQAIQNGMKFGLDIKKQYPLNLEPKTKKNTKLKVLKGQKT
ncbi:MAG: helix-turn-helix transcriptional regulator [Acetobacter sp.]|nr:helix-turn-helix transcriptional regulator [Acetobacter sp.]